MFSQSDWDAADRGVIEIVVVRGMGLERVVESASAWPLRDSEEHL